MFPVINRDSLTFLDLEIDNIIFGKSVKKEMTVLALIGTACNLQQ